MEYWVYENWVAEKKQLSIEQIVDIVTMVKDVMLILQGIKTEDGMVHFQIGEKQKRRQKELEDQ